jgi:hypothetical protein
MDLVKHRFFEVQQAFVCPCSQYSLGSKWSSIVYSGVIASVDDNKAKTAAAAVLEKVLMLAMRDQNAQRQQSNNKETKQDRDFDRPLYMAAWWAEI